MSEKLKPCPFCGGEANLYVQMSVDGFVECRECVAIILRSVPNPWAGKGNSSEDFLKHELAEAWNTRHASGEEG